MEITQYSQHDLSLNTLLELDAEIFPMDNGYWTKINAAKVNPTRHIPHGIKYSLTLHDRYNNRIIGFDNAHACKAKIRRFSGRIITWAHKHKCEKIEPYEYESASQLLEDFWSEVYNIIDS